MPIFHKKINFLDTSGWLEINTNRLFEFKDKFDFAVEWGPTNKTLTDCSKFNLIEVSKKRLVYKLKQYLYFAYAGTLCAGLFLLYFWATLFLQHIIFPFVIAYMVACAAFVAGCCALYKDTKPKCFDLSLGYYWNAHSGPFTDFESKTNFMLNRIYTIQLIKRIGIGPMQADQCYEIVLVLRDKMRIHIMDYLAGKQAKDDAQKLANMIGVPLWDATDMYKD